ncbi:unnamed protein product, partial [Ectocarpus sp. 12 AP-2014]
MPNVTDEELNGAAAALLGLHARNASKEVPPAVAPAPRPAPVVTRADKDQSKPRYQALPRGQNPTSPSVPPVAAAGDEEGRTNPQQQQQPIPDEEPRSHPYPFYPSPVLTSRSGPPSHPEEEQQQQQRRQHLRVDYYSTTAEVPVVSSRQDFAPHTGATGARWIPHPPQKAAAAAAAAVAPPRRQSEWTPRFDPPMAVASDPRAVMGLHQNPPSLDAWAFLQQQQQQQQQRRRHAQQQPEISLLSAAAVRPGGSSRQLFRVYQQQDVAPHHHVVRDQYHRDYATVTAAAAAAAAATHPATASATRPAPAHAARGNVHYPPQQHGYRGQHDERQYSYPPQHAYQQQQQQREYYQEQQKVDKPSINNLWSLIPGTLEMDGGGARPGNNGSTGSSSSSSS